MSHELRTPLNAIIGFSEMIRDAVIGPIDARYREYGSDINRSGRHLQKIINDILDISKIESGRLELRDELVSIGDSVEACRRTLATMAEAAGVALSLDLSGAPPCIRSDEVRFQQILLNLMSNAVKFTPPGGRVALEIAARPGAGVVMRVSDTGVGMDADQIARALDPAAVNGKRGANDLGHDRVEGRGVGLLIAKWLTELHGGTLTVESAKDVGTTATVRLPGERLLLRVRGADLARMLH
jgi:signal transduction histidine kinase